MSKHRWRDSLQSLCENHTDPEEDEQLKLSKIEIQNKISKALKLGNDRRSNKKNRNGEGNSRRESELSQLVEDLSRQYQLIYDLHLNLRRELSQTYNDITEEGFYTASSDSEPEASEEVEVLKQKLTLTAQEKEFSQSKVEELENETKQLKKKMVDMEGELSNLGGALEARNKEASVLMKNLEAQVESLNREKGRLIKQAEYGSKTMKKMKMKESDLEALVLSLKKAMEVKEDQLSALHTKVKGLESELNVLQGKLLRKDQETCSLQDEVASLQEKVNQLQNVAVEYDQVETEQLSSEKALLQGRILELEKQVQERVDEVNHLRLQMTCEREKYQEKLSIVETQNTKLTSKITDQQSVLNQLEKTMNIQLNSDKELLQGRILELEKQLEERVDECKVAKSTINRLEEECKVAKSRILHAAERKMEEMAAQFKKSLESNITILKQRIRVAEQVQTENKENFKSIKEQFLQGQMQQHSEMITTSKAEIANFAESTSDFLDRVDYQVGDMSTRISWVLDEINVMKNWVREMKPDKDELQELEKRVLENEEEVKKVGEEKKEAIRQLCMSVEYHQNRCDHFIKLLSKRK